MPLAYGGPVVLRDRSRSGQLWAVGRTTISFTSTAEGCSIAKAMARATASPGIAMSSRIFVIAALTSLLVDASAKSVGRHDAERGRGGDGDEVAAALRPEDRQRRADPVQYALHIDVDHVVPLVDAQIVEGRDGAGPGIADEDVEPTEVLTGQRDQGPQVVPAVAQP